MIVVDVRITGLEEIGRNLALIGAHARREVGAELYNAAGAVIGRAKAKFREPKSGRVYYYRQEADGTWTKRAQPHRASAPGEAPAIDTGTLDANMYPDVRERGEAGIVSSAAVADVDYAFKLETGADPRVGPRPFMVPSLEEMRGFILARSQAALRRSVEAVRGRRRR